MSKRYIRHQNIKNNKHKSLRSTETTNEIQLKLPSCVLMHIHTSVLVPCSEHNTTVPAVMINILESVNQIRQEAEEPGRQAQARCPSVRITPGNVGNPSHRPLPTRRAINRCRTPPQRRQRRGILVLARLTRRLLRMGDLLRGGLREALGVEILLLGDTLLLVGGDVGVEASGWRGLHVDYLGLAGLLGVGLVVLWLAGRGLSYDLLGVLLNWLLLFLGRVFGQGFCLLILSRHFEE